MDEVGAGRKVESGKVQNEKSTPGAERKVESGKVQNEKSTSGAERKVESGKVHSEVDGAVKSSRKCGPDPSRRVHDARERKDSTYPHALARMMPPNSSRVFSWPSRSIVARICSDPGVTVNSDLALIP